MTINAEQFINRWMRSPTGRKVLTEAEKEQNDQRQHWRDTIDKALAVRNKALPGLRADADAAREERLAAMRTLREKEAAEGQAVAAVLDAMTTVDVAIRHAEGQLLSTADERIGAFIVELRALLNSDRHIPINRAGRTIKLPGGFHREAEYSNLDNINKHIDAVRGAIQEMTALQSAVATSDEIGERIAAVRKRLARTRRTAEAIAA